MCISVYDFDLFFKMLDVIKLCDKLETLEKHIKVISFSSQNWNKPKQVHKFERIKG